MTYGKNGTQRPNVPQIKSKQQFASVPKTEATSINVHLIVTDTDNKVVDVRNWYTTMYEPDVERPSKQGIWIPIEAAKEVAEGILAAVAAGEGKAKPDDEG